MLPPISLLLPALILPLTTASSSSPPPLHPREIDCVTVWDIFNSFSCNTNNFDGLAGLAESQVLEQIISESDLPNSTFFANDEHVTCLFKDAKFVLDDIEVVPDIDIPGTICVYPDDVPQGGLTLGDIKILARQLSDKCSKCGAISAGHVNATTVPDSARGYPRIDWRDPPTCREESNCITAKKINETTEMRNAAAGASGSLTAAAPTATGSSAAGRVVPAGLGDLNVLLGTSVCLAVAFLAGLMVV
ncbi:hypothetical protein QBC41DRAFT_392932 [Cercophora samala]|uniref:Uncharacterized protein n=1 Tax=Cercophora samala TaxID=330535 RepID=A0AA39ZMC5_9PEZI|nr:hypothetical protein QBC41DRAFT_392932 [Cercophora samala]